MANYLVVVEETIGAAGTQVTLLRELGNRDPGEARKRLLEEAKKYRPAGWEKPPFVCREGSDAFWLVPRGGKRHGHCVIRLRESL